MLTRDDKAGLYLTVIFHLVILIILLLTQIGFSLKREDLFVIDFSQDEKKEMTKVERKEERTLDEAVAEKIERMLAGDAGIEFKNTTTSRNKGALKDDRNTDAEKLYADAARLAKDLKNGIQQDDEDVVVTKPVKVEKKDDGSSRSYSGPSVLSWHLDGRKASHLPIPAYRCYGGGMVTVVITVNTSGKVIDARVLDDVSSQDKCLRDFAIRAARMSRFSASPTGRLEPSK